MAECYWLTGAQLRRISAFLRMIRSDPWRQFWDIEEANEVCNLPKQIWYEQYIGEVDDPGRLLKKIEDLEKSLARLYQREAEERTVEDTQPPPVPAGLTVTA